MIVLQASTVRGQTSSATHKGARFAPISVAMRSVFCKIPAA